VARRSSGVLFFAAAARGFAEFAPLTRRAARGAAARDAFGRAATGVEACREVAVSRTRSGACVRDTRVKRICSPME
jgi:hypothetical protein